uniref:Uncharacterized protein n=1 Tax=Arundo donax TaxID=35708 RepID=A0A0A9CZ55_ARUDO
MLGEMLATTGAPETFIEEASYCGLNASKGLLPKERKILSPSAFASILKPLSTVVTARRLPSLLNLKRGRAGRPPSASVQVSILVLSTSQNLIWLSSPAAKK